MDAHLAKIHVARKLNWPDALNARDLGGLPAQGGAGQTRRGVFIRTDSPHKFGPDTIRMVMDSGARMVIDLRLPAEVERNPNPLAGVDGIRYLHEPLLDPEDVETWEKENSMREDWNRAAFIHKQNRVAQILAAMANADGAVVFHCHVGKDRTGIIAASLLAIAGVDAALIAEDYALSDVYLAELYEQIIAKYAGDPEKQAWLRAIMACKPEAMSGALAYLEREHGGMLGYLRAGGLQDENIRRIRQKFVEMR
jgi:protein-tyrosine phosphatase